MDEVFKMLRMIAAFEKAYLGLKSYQVVNMHKRSAETMQKVRSKLGISLDLDKSTTNSVLLE